jgi:hypothetical protein
MIAGVTGQGEIRDKPLLNERAGFEGVARPERFELPTTAFEAQYSIQLSYGRTPASVAGRTPIATSD